MFRPKEEVYRALRELPYVVEQVQPEKLKELPTVIFRVDNNSVNINMDNEISYQNIAITIDIYAKSSAEATTVLEDVEATMRGLLFKLTFSSDSVPSQKGLRRINARFEKIV